MGLLVYVLTFADGSRFPGAGAMDPLHQFMGRFTKPGDSNGLPLALTGAPG